MRVYYHPSVGEYASYPSFEVDHALAGAGILGVLTGAGSYALRGDSDSVMWGLLGAGVGALVGGGLVPKRILSWYNPPPFDAPLRYPRIIPKTVVPSFIGEQGQVLNLLMYEGAGDIVKDYSPYGNHGKIYGATWIDGSFGWALSFDGIDDYIRIGVVDWFTGRKPWTILLWLNTTEYDNVWRRVFSNEGTNRRGINMVRSIYENRIIFEIRRTDGTWLSGVSYIYTPDKWHMVTITFDGYYLRLYENSTLKNQNVVTEDIPASENPFLIGADPIWGDYFKGLIGEIRIYNRALTETEIRYHYESTRAIYE
jgi:hypothetical protein